MTEINTNPTPAPSNPPNPTTAEQDWTSMSLGGTGYELPPSQVKSYTPPTDIMQRIYDAVALAVKVRLQSGSQTVAVAAPGSVGNGGAGIVGTLSNTTLTGGTTPAVTGLIKVYDGNASGTLLWAGTLAAGEVKPLNLPVSTGIYVSIASGSIAVSYS